MHFKHMKDPVQGSMHVVGCTQLDPRELRAPCHITYVVQAEGVEAFSGDQVFELWSRQWPNPGDDLPIRVDRSDLSRIEILTDQIPTHADSARRDADALAAQLRGGPLPGAGSAQPPGGSGAVVSELERLAHLRDTGALTPEEYEQVKTKLLGE